MCIKIYATLVTLNELCIKQLNSPKNCRVGGRFENFVGVFRTPRLEPKWGCEIECMIPMRKDTLGIKDPPNVMYIHQTPGTPRASGAQDVSDLSRKEPTQPHKRRRRRVSVQ